MSWRCTLSGFKMMAKNIPPLKVKLETTYQIDINSYRRIIKAAKKVPPHKISEAEEIEWLNGVGITKK